MHQIILTHSVNCKLSLVLRLCWTGVRNRVLSVKNQRPPWQSVEIQAVVSVLRILEGKSNTNSSSSYKPRVGAYNEQKLKGN